MYSPACLLFYRYTDVSSHFALQNPASHVCWRFILMCHLALDFVHLITVNHPTTMYLIMFGLNTWYSIRTIAPLENFTWTLVEWTKVQRNCAATSANTNDLCSRSFTSIWWSRSFLLESWIPEKIPYL